MKKLKMVMAFAFAALISTTPIKAQTTGTTTGNVPVTSAPKQVPLFSIRQLRAYALAIGNEIDGSISGVSVVGKSYFNVQYPYQDVNVDHMAAIIKAQKFDFDADPTEELSSYVSVNANSNIVPNWGFSLFYASTNFMLVKAGDGWQIPASATSLKLKMSDYIPFKVPGIQNAYIITYDDNGNENNFYSFDQDSLINRDYGFIYFKKEHLNQNGKLYLIFKDSSKYVYDLKDQGDLIPAASPAPASLTPSFEGVRTLPPDVATITFTEGDELVYGTYTGKGTINVVFPAGLKKYPSSVHIVDAAQYAKTPLMDWNDYNVAQPISYNIVSGSILVRFEYDEAPGNLPHDSGKG